MSLAKPNLIYPARKYIGRAIIVSLAASGISMALLVGLVMYPRRRKMHNYKPVDVTFTTKTIGGKTVKLPQHPIIQSGILQPYVNKDGSIGEGMKDLRA